jgi:two-component system LytT family sensor kinase
MRRKLTLRQKLQIVLAIQVMYFPVFMYLDYPVYRPDLRYDLEIFIYQAATLLVMSAVLLVWIYGCEMLLDLVFKRFGEDILIPLNVPRALLVMVFATALGVAFIVLTTQIMVGLEHMSTLAFGKGIRARYPTNETPAFFELYKRANFGFLLLLMMSTFFLIAYDRSIRYVKEMEVNAGIMEKKKVEAELNALRDQISPHFLFNSLSILDAIVQDDPELSRKFIRELSESYRYILEQKRHPTVTMKRELEFIQSYIFLLKMRFENKLRISIDVKSEQKDKYKIPPMALQMLVENAVRHNRMTAEQPLQVTIRTNELGITVVNNLNKRGDSEPSTGIGLQNIVSRYALLTQRPVTIEQLPNEFSVFLPFIE